MQNLELLKQYQATVNGDIIEVTIIEDYDVPTDAIYIEGSFDPNFDDDWDQMPIEITFLVNTIEADVSLTKEEFDKLDAEFVRTVNHEMTHYNQLKEGRFIFNWDGEYLDNPNEIEAYANEGNGSIFN